MKKLVIVITFLCLIPSENFSQKGGEFELGLRSTVSLFSAESAPGFGSGGQFRIRLGNRLNTEWYADLLKNDVGGLGSRTDSHIGWSVMFYPKWYESVLNPYFIAGHCFDYTKVVKFDAMDFELEKVDRWSSAVQAGIGTSWNISKRVNFSLSAQYMMHLGGDIHAEVDDHHGHEELHLSKEAHTGVEGHLLVTLSTNFLIGDLWQK